MIKKRVAKKYNKESYETGDVLEKLVFKYQKSKSEEDFKEIKNNLHMLLRHISLKLYRYKTILPKNTLSIYGIIDKTLKERILAYTPRDDKSRFLGHVYYYLFWYCLTNIRKTIKGPPSMFRRNARRCFASDVLNVRFDEILNNLPSMQQKILREYYRGCLTHRAIAARYEIKQSTVRNTKRTALQKIEPLDSQIYQILIRRG
ncbi:MAG: sigma-70 family RNA polymerase sigma factor [Candidatus Omnitrophica bacterium]|nr:sigma-70 family RNA polymerase sigma factor [Candidatus Omnitrophota bacterium]